MRAVIAVRRDEQQRQCNKVALALTPSPPLPLGEHSTTTICHYELTNQRFIVCYHYYITECINYKTSVCEHKWGKEQIDYGLWGDPGEYSKTVAILNVHKQFGQN